MSYILDTKKNKKKDYIEIEVWDNFNTTLGNVTAGCFVNIGGIDFIVLSQAQSKGATTVITKKPVTKMKFITREKALSVHEEAEQTFTKKSRPYWRVISAEIYKNSEIREYCNTVFYNILKEKIGEENIKKRKFRPTSGDYEMGEVNDKISLMTVANYRKFHKILPKSEHFWLSDVNAGKYIEGREVNGIKYYTSLGCAEPFDDPGYQRRVPISFYKNFPEKDVRPVCVLNSNLPVSRVGKLIVTEKFIK